MIGDLHITRTDPNHATVVDPETGFRYSMTIRPNQVNRIGSNRAAKLRLFVGGDWVNNVSDNNSFHKSVNKLREHFTPLMRKLLNDNRVTLRFSQKAGCSCGCSPGFIVEGADKLRENLIWLNTSGEG